MDKKVIVGLDMKKKTTKGLQKRTAIYNKISSFYKRSSLEYKPIFFNLKRKEDRNRLEELFRNRKILNVIDEYDDQIKELILIRSPKLLKQPLAQKSSSGSRVDLFSKGKWVYYSWRNVLIHVLDKEDFYELRTSRNFPLIDKIEQKRFRRFRIGIAGLNVGNPAALCIALEGGERMKFTDNDVLSVSNLNRFRASLCDLGLNKAILSARQVYEINPYADISVFPSGIDRVNIKQFLLRPRLDALIEEMDNLRLKIEIRELARKYRIPVIMATGNGENVILDIERFDLNPKLELLNGKLKKGVIRAIYDPNFGNLSLKDKVCLARDFMGARYLIKRLRDSFDMIGSKLVSIPQIAESSFLRGAILCYVVRKISAGEKLASGRYYLRLDNLAS